MRNVLVSVYKMIFFFKIRARLPFGQKDFRKKKGVPKKELFIFSVWRAGNGLY